MCVGVSVHTTSNTYDSHGRPFRIRPEGWQNHRDGGRDPTELELAVQPANTAPPVEATPAAIIPPSRLWVGCLGGFPDSFGFVEAFERHFADPNDLYMFQCHILEHEDAGMMGHFVVVA